MDTSVVYINIHRTRFSNEIDHEKQNKSRVQKKENTDGNSTEFKSSYLTHEMVSKPKTCSNIKRNDCSNFSQL